MARNRSPDSIQAEKLYHSGMSLAEIAKKLKKPEGTVRRWKSTQSWDDESERSVIQSERSEIKANARESENGNEKRAVEPEIEEVIKNHDLTDKQRLFCIYYIRCFNATKAYQKAYGCRYETAVAAGPRMLRNVKVRNEIENLKQGRMNREMLSEEDIFQKYMDIAFADITDFVEFGQEEVPVMAMYGPVQVKDEETGEKKTLTEKINTVRFRESTEVDGTLISEVKQGKDGASIKLADRMKALDWISNHMDLATEEQRARIDALKAKADADKEVPINVTFKKASEKHSRN